MDKRGDRYTEHEMSIWTQALIAALGANSWHSGPPAPIAVAVATADDAVQEYRRKRKEARPE